MLIRAGRLARLTVFLALLVVGLAVVALVTIQTAWFKDWLRASFRRGATLSEWRARDRPAGRESADRNRARERERAPERRDARVGQEPRDRLQHPRSRLERVDARRHSHHATAHPPSPDEGWLEPRAALEVGRERSRSRGARPSGAHRFHRHQRRVGDDRGRDGVHGHTPRRITRLDFKGGFAYEPVDFTLEVAHLSFRAFARKNRVSRSTASPAGSPREATTCTWSGWRCGRPNPRSRCRVSSGTTRRRHRPGQADLGQDDASRAGGVRAGIVVDHAAAGL